MASRTLLRIPSRVAPSSRPISSSFCRCAGAQWQSRPRKTFPARTRGFASTPTLQEKKYTEDHEWVELDESGETGTIGITNYAAKQLGDVVFVEIPALELDVNAGDSIGAVESVKSAADINTPIGGTVVAVNEVLQEKPGTINKGPEAEGWIAKIKLKDVGELNDLMTKEAYDEFAEE